MMMALFRELFEQHIKMRWLKTINKACDKYFRIESRLVRQHCVVNDLLARYKEIYGEDLRAMQKRGAGHDSR